MENTHTDVRAAVSAALARRQEASVASIASVLREVHAAVATQLPDEEIVAMILDAAPRYQLGLLFDHRGIKN
jgi:hypothetical protein